MRFYSTITAGPFVLAFLSCFTAANSAAESLEFQRSKDQWHVEVQPRQDYHRVHLVVKAQGLAGQQCIARLTCSTDNHLVEDSRVVFVPTRDSQACAIYLRTPKLITATATYVLQVAPSDAEGPDLSRKSALIYMWTVTRDAAGNASVTSPKAGDTFTIMIPVSRKVPDGGEVGFKIVWETKTKSVTVPQGFSFGVNNNSTDDVFEPVLLLGE
jgi:hypothetical protein